MAKDKRQPKRKISYDAAIPVLVAIRELKDTERRLLAIEAGLGISAGAITPRLKNLETVLPGAIVTEARGLDGIARRLNALLGLHSVKLDGGA